MAELDYGKEKMDAYRRAAERVGEPAPSFQLCSGTQLDRPHRAADTSEGTTPSRVAFNLPDSKVAGSR